MYQPRDITKGFHVTTFLLSCSFLFVQIAKRFKYELQNLQTYGLRFVKSINIDINTTIRNLQKEKAYKYLCIQEGNNVQHLKMKEKIRK